MCPCDEMSFLFFYIKKGKPLCALLNSNNKNKQMGDKGGTTVLLCTNMILPHNTCMNVFDKCVLSNIPGMKICIYLVISRCGHDEGTEARSEYNSWNHCYLF